MNKEKTFSINPPTNLSDVIMKKKKLHELHINCDVEDNKLCVCYKIKSNCVKVLRINVAHNAIPMIRNFPNVEDIEIKNEKWLREINGANIKKLILNNMTITNPLLLISFVNVNIIEMWNVTIDNQVDDFITGLSSMKKLSAIKIVLLNIKENNINHINTKFFQSLSNFVLLKEFFLALQTITEEDVVVLCSQLKFLPLLSFFTLCSISKVKNIFSSLKSEISNLPNLRSFTFSNYNIKEFFNQMEPFTNCIVRSIWDNDYSYIK